MAVSVVFRFTDERDALATYDAIIAEMELPQRTPPGAVYHWAAATEAGLIVSDVWESPEQFEAFATTQIGPLTRKHGLKPPLVEVSDIYKRIDGFAEPRRGIGIFVELVGDTKALLAAYDAVNERVRVDTDIPDGLVVHIATATAGGIRIIDHWRSREDFESFGRTRLGPALQASGMPQPRFSFFELHNVIDSRKAPALER